MAGPFQILDIPASGAYGTVCVARRLVDDQVVALKVMRAEHRDPDVARRARDEARMLAKMHHPNIVQVHELLEHEGRPIVVMEHVDGVSLHHLLRAYREGAPPAVVIEVVRQVALALDAAYNSPADKPMRLVHRDIKPSNVLLSVQGEVKVVDFGTARAEFDGREAVTLNLVMGSVGYTAPERYEGVPDSPSGDVYALGVLLFVLLSGKQVMLPRAKGKHDEAMHRQLKYVVPEIPAQALQRLHHTIAHACARDWRQRPDPATLAQTLSEVLAHAQLSPNLSAFGQEVITPLRAKQTSFVPHEHEDWDALCFLETDEMMPPQTTEVVAIEPREADAALRAFLTQPGWENDFKALEGLLASHPGWTAGPFLPLLAQAAQPGWKFWRRSTRPSAVMAALRTLVHRPSPPVLKLARRLTHHKHAGIARAATDLLRHAKPAAG